MRVFKEYAWRTKKMKKAIILENNGFSLL